MDVLHTKYFIDELGFLMVDHCGMWVKTPGSCFVCKRLTHRLDTTFQTFYCDSRECNEWITEDLERLDKSTGGAVEDFG